MEDLKMLIIGDITDIIVELNMIKNKVENCNNMEHLEEYDEIIHKDIYNLVDTLDYVEK